MRRGDGVRHRAGFAVQGEGLGARADGRSVRGTRADQTDERRQQRSGGAAQGGRPGARELRGVQGRAHSVRAAPRLDRLRERRGALRGHHGDLPGLRRGRERSEEL